MCWKNLGVAVLGIAIMSLYGSGLQAAEKKERDNGHQQMMDKMAERLGLSDDQKDQVKKVLADYMQKRQALDQERDAAIDKLLSPEQQTKRQEMMKEMRGRRGNRNNNNNDNNNSNNNDKENK